MENGKAQLRYIPQEEQGLQLCHISTVAESSSSRGHVGLVDEKHATAKNLYLSFMGCGVWL
jgi:hypothetical protein